MELKKLQAAPPSSLHSLSTSYIPDELPGRQAEIEKLLKLTNACLVRRYPKSVFVTGCPGTGKTATLKKICSELRENAGQRQYKGKTKFEWVAATTLRREDEVTTLIADALGFPGYSLEEIEEACEDAMHKPMLCFVLDEADQVFSTKAGKAVISKLFRWTLRPACPLLFVAIANAIDLAHRVVATVAIQQHKPIVFNFRPYDSDDVQQILHARLEVASSEIAVDETVVSFIAKKVCSSSGDIRKAIEMLRKTIITTETTSDVKSVTIASANKVALDAMGTRLVKILNCLPQHVRIAACACVAASLAPDEEVAVRDIYFAYQQLCRRAMLEPSSQASFFEYITALEDSGVVLSTKSRSVKNATGLGKLSIQKCFALPLRVRATIADLKGAFGTTVLYKELVSEVQSQQEALAATTLETPPRKRRRKV